jgi:hypothetical protein
MKKLLSIDIALFLILLVAIFFLGWYPLHGDILFHTDIARDFLAIEDIVQNHHLTLLGPRSGGISGVFHGPLWFYISIPAFILGHGDPIIVGWFWSLLSFTTIGITYFSALKLFDKRIALLSATSMALLSITSTNSLFNPYGAVMLSPIFFYLFYQYTLKNRYIFLLSSIFTLGVIIQFQMAWGVPILFLVGCFVVINSIKKKRLVDLTSFLILPIPLATFFLFELKHNFLQIHSVLTYLHTPHDGKFSWLTFFITRLKGIFVEGPSLITGASPLFCIIPLIAFSYLLIKVIRDTHLKHRSFYLLFFYLYGGFWLITFLFKGTIWGYYYWPFLAPMFMIFYSLKNMLPQKIFAVLASILLLLNAYNAWGTIKGQATFTGRDPSSWKFNLQVAKKIYKLAPSEFGYYIFTPDQYGYTPRYAMDFVQTTSNKKAFPYTKKARTYLLVAPAPKDKPYLNGEWWREHQVNIMGNPQKLETIENGFKIFTYDLTPEQLVIPADPNLIMGLEFR